MRINIIIFVKYNIIIIYLYNFSHSRYCRNTKAEYTVIICMYIVSCTRVYYNIVIIIEQLKIIERPEGEGQNAKYSQEKLKRSYNICWKVICSQRAYIFTNQIIFLIQFLYVYILYMLIFNKFNELRNIIIECIGLKLIQKYHKLVNLNKDCSKQNSD